MRYRINLIATASFSGLAASALAWGWFDADGLRADSPGHATAVIAGAIGLLLGLPVLGAALAVCARVRATRAASEGRWSVTPADIAGLQAWQRRIGDTNEWRPTRGERARGIEVCWAGEDLVVGGHYWRVAPGQYPTITAVRAQLAPPASIALHYRQVWAHNMSSVPRLLMTERTFRFPAPDDAQARSFARHFSRLLDGERAADRLRRLRRLSSCAFGASAVFLALLLSGLGVAWHDRANGIYRTTPQRAALIATTVFGIMGTPTLLLAGVAVRSRMRSDRSGR